MQILEQTILPTKYGEFDMIAIDSGFPDFPHIILKAKKLNTESSVLVRIHSECMTGDVFGSARCDCGEQLDVSMRMIGEKDGILIYLRQEGRGIGMINKMKAYNLQDQGLDTFEANIKLGFHQDERKFDLAIEILNYLEVNTVDLLTNNPEKIKIFEDSIININNRVPIQTLPTKDNIDYLSAKKSVMGHLLQ